MEKDKYITEVIFRKFNDGEILALFPYDIFNHRGGVTSYVHVGQHGEADYRHCVNRTNLATEQEYKDLKEELESIGYNLKAVKKRDAGKYLTAYKNSLIQ